jgi:superoxide reductase
VAVGLTQHANSKDNYIKRIYLVTAKGLKYKLLEPEDKPVSVFTIDEDDEVLGAYAYCVFHGLWYTEKA